MRTTVTWLLALLLAHGCGGGFESDAPGADDGPDDTGPPSDTVPPDTGPTGPRTPEGLCANGIDDDRDGDPDCVDPDCVADAACAPVCPEAALDTVPGTLEGMTWGEPDAYGDAVCGGVGASDLPVRFTAPHDGTFVATVDAAFDSALRLWDTCGGLEVACADTPGVATESMSVPLAQGASVVWIVDGAGPGQHGRFTLTVEEVLEGDCGDGLDTDGDGLTDCVDPDCVADAACRVDCADQLLTAAVPSSTSWTPSGDDLAPVCGSPDLEDVVLDFTAPTTGRYVLDTFGSDVDTVLAVWADCSGAELACATDTLSGTSMVVLDLVAGQAVVLVLEAVEASGTVVLAIATGPDTEGPCGDGIDADLDGLTDCADPDCDPDVTCGEVCDNGVDDDADGQADCSDRACSGDPACPATCPEQVADTLPATLVGSTVGAGNQVAGACGGGLADDVTIEWLPPSTGPVLAVLEADFDAILAPLAGCGAAELDCALHAAGGQTVVALDADAGLPRTFAVDGWFAGDEGDFTLRLVTRETVEVTCGDGIDNDLDGDDDCDDPDCDLVDPCLEVCDDLVDNDDNDRLDCLDDDCIGEPACAPTCPDLTLAAPGTVTGDTQGRADTSMGSCDVSASYGDDPAPDQTVAFTAPNAGNWAFSLSTSETEFDSVLVVRDACGGAELGCDDRFFPDPFGGEVVVVALAAGQTVVAVVDGFDGAQGAFALAVVELTGPEATCDDGFDDDGDGDTDCFDTDCATDPACTAEVVCDDDADNDGDFDADCEDDDCAADPFCVEACGDTLDNDLDGRTDCFDPDCVADPACPETCDDGLDNDGDGDIDCADAACDADPLCLEVLCGDGVDNDASGQTDCLDPDCAADAGCLGVCPALTASPSPATVLGSTAGLPDQVTASCDISGTYGVPPPTSDQSTIFTATADGTYLFALDARNTTFDTLLAIYDSCGGAELGCQDRFFPAPFGGEAIALDLVADQSVVVVVDGFSGQSGTYGLQIQPVNATETCDDGIDDDNDLLLDCADPDCTATAHCAAEADCTNVFDDDGDFLFDCIDDDCASDPACQEICDDGVDNDDNLDIDCHDADCVAEPHCIEPCPAADLPSPPTQVVSSTIGLANDVEPSCTLQGNASDITYRFTAPAPGNYTFDTRGSSYDTALAILDACGGTELACNDDDPFGLQSALTIGLDGGQTVIVVVDGYGGNAGSVVLTVR